MAEDNLQLIGEFLRRKRESLAPEIMGLPKPIRSRTPGLRREDVAFLAGISSVWYSKIERGKAGGISAGVLTALIEALCLTPSEQAYLNTLASRKQLRMKAPCRETSAESRRLLTQLNPLPALFLNDYFDVVATNHSFNLICGFSVEMVPEEERNYVWMTLTNPQWQQYLQISDEDSLKTVVKRLAGYLRNALASRPNDHRLLALVSRLQAFPVFAAEWGTNTVQQCPDSMVATFHHAVLGAMTFKKQVWSNCYGETSGRLNIYYPQSDEDFERLAGLHEQVLNE